MSHADLTERALRFTRENAPRLRALAYRMLGSRSDAQDVVQDAWLRFSEVDASTVHSEPAYLTTLVTRLYLDRLNAAATRREQYVGTWLPEPLVDEGDQWCPGPEVQTEFAQDVSVAFMLALERLSPLERAAFLLHDVFDLDFDEVASKLQRSPQACRQLASRARSHVRAAYVRSEVAHEHAQQLLQAFGQAVASGDIGALAQLLAADAVLLSDGGGRVSAVPRPLVGAPQIARALLGFARSIDPSAVRIVPGQVNGLPGCTMFDAAGRPLQTLALRLEVADAGAPTPARVAAIYIVRNPEKLRHLASEARASG